VALPRLSVRKALGWIALVCLAVAGVVRPASAHGQHLVTRGAEEYLFVLAVAVLAVAIPRRVRRTGVFLFEGGMVRESNPGPRPLLVVLPWADLAKVTTSLDDDDLLSSCELRGSGTKLLLGRSNHDGYLARLAIMRAAQQVLAGQSPGT
jgi:hypothetical protein